MGTSELFYIECKSGGVDYDQIIKATERGKNIFASVTAIAIGHSTQFNRLQATLAGKPCPGIDAKPKLKRISISNFPQSEIFAWHTTFFLPYTRGNVSGQLDTILRLQALQQVIASDMVGVNDDDYARLGFTLCS